VKLEVFCEIRRAKGRAKSTPKTSRIAEKLTHIWGSTFL
jgi:hypothetical protein